MTKTKQSLLKSQRANVLGNAADASVALSICDGKRIHTVFASTAGTIATAPSKNGTSRATSPILGRATRCVCL